MHLIRTFFTAYPRQSVMTLAALLLGLALVLRPRAHPWARQR